MRRAIMYFWLNNTQNEAIYFHVREQVCITDAVTQM